MAKLRSTVLLLTMWTLGVAQTNDNNVHQGFCPPQTPIDLSDDSRNVSGLVAEPEDSNTTRCVCESKPCLAICPRFTRNDTGRFYVIKNYTNYSAIPRVRTTDETIDDVAADPRKWFNIFVWRPCRVKSMYFLDPVKNELDEFHLLRNGSLFLPNRKRGAQMLQGSRIYCLRLSRKGDKYTPLVCSPKTNNFVKTTNVDKIRYVGCLVAVPFILFTILVYSVLPELRNIHGTTLRCYLSCLALMNVAVGVDRLRNAKFETTTWCLCLGFFNYFSSIACYSWLNVMCFDVWRRLGSFRSIGISGFQSDHKKFLWYSIYVWSISVLMTLVCIGMEFSPGIPASVIRPGFDANACWFSEIAIPYYYFGPTGISICCNICLFVSVSIKLCQHEKIMRRDFDAGSNGRHNHNKQWFGLYLKLFVVMGVCWSTETISSFWQGPEYLWYVPHMVNALQGLLIFLIFVCKRRIWLSLKKQYGKKKLRGANDSRGSRDTASQSFSNTREEKTFDNFKMTEGNL